MNRLVGNGENEKRKMRDERKSPRGIFALTDGTPDGRLASGTEAGPLTDSQNKQSRGQPSIFEVCVVVSISVAAHPLAAVPTAGRSPAES